MSAERDADADPRGGASRRRWIVRFTALAVALGLLLPDWKSDWAALAVPAVSPFTAVMSTIAARLFSVVAIVALPVLVVVLLRRRWVCRYACPTGLLADLAAKLRGGRVVRRTRLPFVGPWLVWLTLGGALLGYPLFLWLDPLAIFSGFVNAWGRGAGQVVWSCAAALPVLLLVSVLWPGLWCMRLCPLGACQDLLYLSAHWWRRRSAVEAATGTTPSRHWPLSRRAAIGLGVGVLGGMALLRWGLGRRPKPLRPPGAVDEARFSGLCVRCGNCARVCPSHIIHADIGQSGRESLLTPVIQFADEYCLETCQRCTQVCPSGALRRLTADEKPRAVIGRPRVDMSICLLGDDQECAVCRRVCPYEAIRLVFSETDYLNTPTVTPARCNGCGACQVKCPTTPAKAIVIVTA